MMLDKIKLELEKYDNIEVRFYMHELDVQSWKLDFDWLKRKSKYEWYEVEKWLMQDINELNKTIILTKEDFQNSNIEEAAQKLNDFSARLGKMEIQYKNEDEEEV